MVHFIAAYRGVLFYGTVPAFSLYMTIGAIGGISLLGGWLIFVVKERAMVKEL
jgi:ABC-type polysaccharide/polyol phosphate export permease